ncbi:MAG: DegV family protein [Chloroflexi bacterium]|nr:DegV family protein [Chloroflexota bacterium]
MARVKIVTDSTSDLPPALVKEWDITVVPLLIHFGSETYVDRVNISEEQFFARLTASPLLPTTSPPSVKAFQDVYAKLSQTTDAILSVHISSKLSATYAAAVAAREALTNRCRIVIVDSTLTSMALGFMALNAAKAAAAGESLDDIAEQVRGMIPQTHILFFVDTLDYLQKGGRIGKAQALMSNVLNVKPLLRLEDGEIYPVERLRTRAKALERLYEFVADFPKIEELAILYSTTPNEANTLARRIDAIFPRQRIQLLPYGPVLGVHVGPGAMAVVVYEGEE